MNQKPKASLVVTPESCLLATLVLRAAFLHEDSFDWKAAYEARNSPSVAEVKRYRLTLQEAVAASCHLNPELEQPVYLLLSSSWNDALAWASQHSEWACTPDPVQQIWKAKVVSEGTLST